MAAQLDYGYRIPKGIPGGKADIGFDAVVTRKNEEEDGVLKYGMAVVEGTEKGHTIKLPVSASTKANFQGVVIANANTEQDMEGHVHVRKNAAVSCMLRGRMWGRLAPGAEPAYGGDALIVKDGDYAGCFTSQSSGYTAYVKVDQGTADAKLVVADDDSPEGTEVKLSTVTPCAGFTPAVGDYVLSKKLYEAPLDAGVKFGNESDVDNGIAIVEGY